jgi:two-component system sensor histidine kinase/response regulator
MLLIVSFFSCSTSAEQTIKQQLSQIEDTINSDIQRSLTLIQQLNTNKKAILNNYQQAKLHNITAYIYILSGKYKLAYQHVSKAHEKAKIINDLYEIAESKRLEAVIYSLTDLQEESLPLFLEALEIHKKLSSNKVYNTLQGISLYYRETSNFEKFLEYGHLLLKQPITNHNKRLKGVAEYTIGEGYLKLGDYSNARKHLNLSIALLEGIDTIFLSEIYVSLAELTLLEGHPLQALNILNISKVIANERSYSTDHVKMHLLFAQTHLAVNHTKKSEKTLDELLLYTQENNDLYGEKNTHTMYVKTSVQHGNYQQALYHQQKATDISEVINQQRLQIKSNFYRTKLDVEQKELHINQLKSEKNVQLLESKQREKAAKLRDAILALLFIILAFLIYYVIHARKIKQKMEKLAIDAEIANQAKSSFLAKMSHEIRTPMNAIIGLSQLALNANLSPKQRENISMVHASSQSLLTLLNDILDFSKIEAKKLELEQADFILNTSIQRLLNVCSFSADEKQLKLNVTIDNDVPVAFIGDALRLEQILINLVNNAIKFTQQGDITINISLLKQTNSINTLKFSVVDQGIGIGEDQLQRLFSEFSQADTSVTRRYGGSGLGLTICKELVELMGGTITVKSELGAGSCFSFTMDILTSNTVNDQLIQYDLSRLTHLKILIVDDSKSSRTLLSETLIDIGLESAQARSGIEGLEQIKTAIDNNCPFDFVFMDWRMPGLDGLESIRIINQVVSKQLPKFVLVSSFDKSDAIKLSRHLPVADVLEKPVKQSQLINSLLNIASTQQGTTSTPTAITYENFKHVHLLLAEDNIINQKVILGFLAETGIQIDIANNGVEAVNKARNATYDIIMMDIQMPEMDGLSATLVIRNELKIDTPIVAMTAHSMQEDIEQSLAAGMNLHLTKPINANLLIATIKKLVRAPDLT